MAGSSPAARRSISSSPTRSAASARRSTYLAKTSNIDPKLPVRDWRLTPRFSEFSFLHLGSAALLETIGLGAVARRLESLGLVQAAEKLNLDGLLALWHPSPEN